MRRLEKSVAQVQNSQERSYTQSRSQAHRHEPVQSGSHDNLFTKNGVAKSQGTRCIRSQANIHEVARQRPTKVQTDHLEQGKCCIEHVRV